jgi:hypothetical protein
MTWLGKILTFLVLIGVAVWAYLTVQAYVTRTNWKAELERYKAEVTKMRAAHEQALNAHASSEDALKRQIANEQKRSEGLSRQVAMLTTEGKTATAKFMDLQTAFDENDVQAKLLATNLDNAIKELTTVRFRNNFLEDDRVRLVIAAEEARREMVRARNAERLAQAIADDNAKRVEELLVRVADLRASGGRDLRSMLDKPPPPVLPNLHGEVERVVGDLVEIGIGIDAGVSKGTILEVSRTAGGGQYLGTIKIIDVYPKQAVGNFRPARPVPFDRLRPEELPKKGDEVRPPEGGR